MDLMDFYHGVQDTLSDPQALAGITTLETFRGTVTFRDGTLADCLGLEAIRFGEPGEPFFGYLVLRLDDGATGWQSFEVSGSTAEPDGALVGTGIWRWTSGTGRLAGLSGGGVLAFRYQNGRWRATFDGQPDR